MNYNNSLSLWNFEPCSDADRRRLIPPLTVSFAENRLGPHSFGRGINWLRPILGIRARGRYGAPAFAPQVGTLYVRKSAMPGGKIPKTLIVTITGE